MAKEPTGLSHVHIGDQADVEAAFDTFIKQALPSCVPSPSMPPRGAGWRTISAVAGNRPRQLNRP